MSWVACSHGEIPSMSWIACSHHVLGIEHLLSELWNSEGTVLLRATSSQGGEPRHEEVETREGDHVHGQLPQVSIQLSREPERGGDSGHGKGNQVVKITIGGVGQLQGSEADIVESLVINTVGLVGILNKLVN